MGLATRSITLVLIAALIGCGSGGDSSAISGTSAGQGGAGVDDIRQDMLAAINLARSAGRTCGTTYYGAAAPVAWNDKIAAAALRHSADMAANNFFSHTGSDNSSPGDRLTSAGYPWVTYGENIGVGYSSATSAVQAWLASAGHCANIMNPGFAEIGAAYSQGPFGGSTAALYWTLDLGR
jgi:uncharacterized protein YkwD